MDFNEYRRYRQEQEKFVSNLDGSSAFDVFLTILPNTCSVLLCLTSLTLLGPQINYNFRIFIELLFTVIPCILCCTVLSGNVLQISQGMLLISVANLLSILAFKKRDTKASFPSSDCQNRIPFITNFRAGVNIVTVVCILAVDFTCFPRKLAKTETYGYSLMDTGVGLFMVANALVAPEARKTHFNLKEPFVDIFVKNIKDCIPLLALGSGRYLSVELLGYQRHVSEYGVHWNFFLTLVFVKLFVSLLPRTLTFKYPLLAGSWILCMHEYALSTNGLKEWVLSNGSRNDFLSANREGWISIPGYVGLYLIGISIGKLIHSTYNKNKNSKIEKQKQFHLNVLGQQLDYTWSIMVCFKLILISIIMVFLTAICDNYFKVSRRLANLGYCVWILALSCLSLLMLVITDIILETIILCLKEKPKRKITKYLKKENVDSKNSFYLVKTLEIYEAINNNGLTFFILANLLTGVINLSIKTLTVDEVKAICIIIVYMIVNIVTVLIKHRRNCRSLTTKKT